jgi:hypothetical protein
MLLAIVLSLFTSPTHAFTCGTERWVTPPALREGKFMGTLEASCTLKKTGGDVRQLDAHFRSKVLAQVTTRHEGPLADHTLGLPGVLFDVTVRHEGGTLRNLVKIATDGRDAFAYDARSKEVSLPGMAGYLRKLDVIFKVTRVDSDSFKLTLTNTTHVAKPTLAPGGIFLGIAKDKARDEFLVQLPKLAQEVEQSL